LFVFLRDFLGWAVLLNFLVYITVPVVLHYTGILLGIGSFAIYINTIIGLAKKENYFWEQVNFTDFIGRKSMDRRSTGFRLLGLRNFNQICGIKSLQSFLSRSWIWVGETLILLGSALPCHRPISSHSEHSELFPMQRDEIGRASREHSSALQETIFR
jgi:hypothetical protein